MKIKIAAAAFVLFASGILFSFALSAHAAKETVIYPDPQLLQPLPPGANFDVENAVGNSSPTGTAPAALSAPAVPAATETAPSAPLASHTSPWLVVGIIAIITGIVFLIVRWISGSKKDSLE